MQMFYVLSLRARVAAAAIGNGDVFAIRCCCLLNHEFVALLLLQISEIMQILAV